MNSPVTFVTTNNVKFDSAARIAADYGITLHRAKLELQEIQADDGEIIARHKAEQAFAALQTPIVITDDSWDIPGLNGFPGAYMKSMNEWFTPEDFLRLTLPLKDRRIILRQHTVYQDVDGQHYFVDDIVGTLLTEVRGTSKYKHLTITSFDGSQQSRAETLAAGQPLISSDMPSVWHQLADWLNAN